MSRSQRLMQLLQLLRGYRYPVSGAELAGKLGISVRTLYRDIATLQAQGACIEGEAGVGYVLRPGFLLPPLMFTEEEIEALVLGARWVSRRTDLQLQDGAKSALAKISASIPRALKQTLDDTTLLIGPASNLAEETIDAAQLRQAIRSECKVIIQYRNEQGSESERVIWPFAIGYFEQKRILVAWCELRQGIRHFRTDRILSLEIGRQKYPHRRQALMKEWLMHHNIPSQ